MVRQTVEELKSSVEIHCLVKLSPSNLIESMLRPSSSAYEEGLVPRLAFLVTCICFQTLVEWGGNGAS